MVLVAPQLDTVGHHMLADTAGVDRLKDLALQSHYLLYKT